MAKVLTLDMAKHGELTREFRALCHPGAERARAGKIRYVRAGVVLGEDRWVVAAGLRGWSFVTPEEMAEEQTRSITPGRA